MGLPMLENLPIQSLSSGSVLTPALTPALDIVVSVVAAVFAARFVMKRWLTDSRDMQQVSAETSVVELLRVQLDRATKHNEEMVVEIDSFRKLAYTLRSEIEELKAHNVLLQAQILVFIKSTGGQTARED